MRSLVASLCLLAAIAGCAPEPVRLAPRSVEPPASRAARSEQVPQSLGQIQLSFAPVVRRAAPAVVNIYTRKVVERRRSPFANDPFFRQFFGDVFEGLGTRRRMENSLGSGVILDPNGIVVSNNHVVQGADEITVVLADKREFDARLILADERSDLAVLALEGAVDLPALELRDSDTIEVGDLVLAIGNPFGVGQTVTSGIVSGLARSGRRQGTGYFIQTDAAINPGNSGGALVDMSGRLVGVNTSILSRSGGSNGIGFAVPADLVGQVVASAKAGRTELARPWFGLRAQPVTGELADALGLDRARGLLIDDLHDDSELRRAGVAPGDVLVAIGPDPVGSLAELEFRTATLGVGGAAEITLLRDGRERVVRVPLVAVPERPERARLTIRRGRLAGLTVETINPALIDERGLALDARGVLVLGVQSVARRSGLRPGDILVAANGRPLADTGELRALYGRGRALRLEVSRDGRRGEIAIGG